MNDIRKTSISTDNIKTVYYKAVTDISKKQECDKAEAGTMLHETSIGNYVVYNIIKGFKTSYVINEIYIFRLENVYKIVIDEDYSNGYKIYYKSATSQHYEETNVCKCVILNDRVRIFIKNHHEEIEYVLYYNDYQLIGFDVNIQYN